MTHNIRMPFMKRICADACSWNLLNWMTIQDRIYSHTSLTVTVRSKNMFAFSNDERAFNIASFSHRTVKFTKQLQVNCSDSRKEQDMSVGIHPPLQYYVPFWPHPSPNQYSSQEWTPQIPEAYLKPELQLLLMQLLQQLQANSSETGTCDEFRNLAGREELARSNENRRCDKRTAQFSPGLPQGSLLDCMDSYSTNDTREGEILYDIINIGSFFYRKRNHISETHYTLQCLLHCLKTSNGTAAVNAITSCRITRKKVTHTHTVTSFKCKIIRVQKSRKILKSSDFVQKNFMLMIIPIEIIQALHNNNRLRNNQISVEKTKRSNLTRILEEKNKELIQLQKKAKMFIDTLSVPQDGRHFLQFRNELNQLHDKLWRMQYSFVEDLTQMEEGIQEFFRTNGGQEKYSLNKLKITPNYTPRRRDFRSRGDVAYDEDDLKFFKEAILKNNLDSVKNIIADKKADINGIIDGKTPIMHAIKTNALDVGEYLIYNGADIELVSDDVTPLQKAVTWNRIQFAELLLKSNADANAKTNGVTALYIAADKDLYNMSKLLLDYGADPNIFSGSFSALHIVRHAGIAKLLVEKGADVNACSPTRRNWTPLHQSAEKNHHEKAVFLITNGAELDLTDDWEITPLTLTATTNNQKLAHFLLLHHSDPNKSNETLMTAVKSGHLKLTKLLLEFNANVHTSDDRGWTAFHEAVSRDDEEMVALFLDFGADPDNAYSYAMTPRDYAKEYELDVLSMFP
ncbi:hypothetical protein ANN_09007 [Periplaneta americana]|uniref:Uncharacterized protein n=1 Tax=Periplaneta americana TaxID=6978 RepID=A0ABQ8TMA2_PERAM|nr:hypothetical protein ANN_09007 [Periplaneta americana]